MSTPILDCASIVRASEYPISFIVISVGPRHDDRLEFYDGMRGRKFDNFTYVNYTGLKQDLDKYFIKYQK